MQMEQGKHEFDAISHNVHHCVNMRVRLASNVSNRDLKNGRHVRSFRYCLAEMLETLAEDVLYTILDLLDMNTRARLALVHTVWRELASVKWRVLDLTLQRNESHVLESLESLAARNSQSVTSITLKVNWTCKDVQPNIAGPFSWAWKTIYINLCFILQWLIWIYWLRSTSSNC